MVSLILLAARSAKNHRTSGPVLWTPANLTTPPVQWENNTSTLILDTNGNCRQWADLSTSGNNTWGSMQGASLQPSSFNPSVATGQNGLRVLRFGGSQGLIQANSATLSLTANITSFTIFFAGAPTKNAGSLQRLTSYTIGGTLTNTRCGMTIASNNVSATQRRLDSDTGVSATVAQPDSNFHLYSSEHNWTAQTVAIRLDGGTATTANTSQGSGSTQNTASVSVDLMGDPSASQFASGDVGEFIALGYIPGTTDRQLIEGYVAWRWGIEANLPSGHPYKSAPPYV